MMPTLDTQSSLTSLDPYLTRIAYNLQATDWPMVDAQDILQEMRFYVLQQAALPGYSSRTPGHVAKGAAWHARHVLRDTFTRWHNGARIAWADPLPEGMAAGATEPDDAALDASMLVERLFALVERLFALVGDKIRQALQLKLEGYTVSEIADMCSVTTMTVYRWEHKAKAILDALD